jgi:DNA-binding MarR family transcriptional regulator
MAANRLRTNDKRQEALGFAMEKTVKMMKQSFNRLLLAHPEIDITVDQWVLINIIKKHGLLSQQELGVLTFKDAPTITRMIDLLVLKGIMWRQADLSDRRKFNITLTEQGEMVFHRIEPIVKEFRAAAYAHISDDDLNLLDEVMKKIFDNLAKLH